MIAEDIEGEALATLIVNQLRGNLKSCAVKSPGFGDRRKAMLHDIAILTGAQMIAQGNSPDPKLETATLDQLGKAKRVVCDTDINAIVGGGGQRSAIDDRSPWLLRPKSQRPQGIMTRKSCRSVWRSCQAALQ